MSVAFLGLGPVGARLAEAVARHGFVTSVWDAGDGLAAGRAGADAAGAVAAGASVETDAARAARHADVVVTSLVGPEAVREMLFGGEDPVAGQLRAHAVVVDTSTTGPRAARAVATELDQRGIRFVEAPVVGAPQPPENTFTTLTGGDAHVVEAVRAVLQTWTTPGRLIHMGGAGSANAAKLVVAAGVGVAAEGIGEALRLGQDLLLDRTRLIQAMLAGPFGALVADKEQLLLAADASTNHGAGTAGVVTAGASVTAMLADLSAALYESSSALPAIEAAYLQARLAAATGRGGHDFIEIALRRESRESRDEAAEGVVHTLT